MLQMQVIYVYIVFFYTDHYYYSYLLCSLFYIFQPYKKEFSVTKYGPLKGYHGYDPQYSDMRGIFVATGPGNYYILHRCISCSENNHHIAIFIPQSLYLQQ